MSGHFLPPAGHPPYGCPILLEVNVTAVQVDGTILIIETDGIERFAVKALSHTGWGVISAHDSIEGIRVMRQVDPDLLLFEANAYSVGRICFWDEARKGLCSTAGRKPLVVLMPSHSSLDEISALDDGADDFLRKPISKALLVARIRRMLNRSCTSQPYKK